MANQYAAPNFENVKIDTQYSVIPVATTEVHNPITTMANNSQYVVVDNVKPPPPNEPKPTNAKPAATTNQIYAPVTFSDLPKTSSLNQPTSQTPTPPSSQPSSTVKANTVAQQYAPVSFVELPKVSSVNQPNTSVAKAAQQYAPVNFTDTKNASYPQPSIVSPSAETLVVQVMPKEKENDLYATVVISEKKKTSSPNSSTTPNSTPATTNPTTQGNPTIVVQAGNKPQFYAPFVRQPSQTSVSAASSNSSNRNSPAPKKEEEENPLYVTVIERANSNLSKVSVEKKEPAKKQSENKTLSTSDKKDDGYIHLLERSEDKNSVQLDSRWFCGSLSREATETILLKCKERVFLVRESSQAGAFSLSKYDPFYPTPSDRFGHLLIGRDPKWHLKSSRDANFYNTIDELIKNTPILEGFIPIGDAKKKT